MTNDEIRNSNECSKRECSNFGHWNFIRISNFEFRHSPLPAALCLLLTACCLLPASLSAGEPRELLPLGKPAYAAQWTGATRAWQWQFLPAAADNRAKPEQLLAADIVSWGAPLELPAKSAVFFVDGGVLLADVRQLNEDRLEIESPLFGRLALPIEVVQGLIVASPTSLRLRDRLAARLFVPQADGRPADSDRVILDNGDEISGSVLRLDERALELKSSVSAAKIELTKIAALAFNPSLLIRPSQRGLRTLIGFKDGSRLTAEQLEIDGDSLKLVPIDRSALEGASWTTQPDAVVFLQPLGGRAVYLSDLVAASYRHIPYLSLAWPYTLDHNLTGGPLRAGDRLYAKGIGMHSAARLTYRLERPFRRFEAELAIDAETAGRGSVTFRVFADREQKYASDVIRGGQPPLPISVDIRGAKQVSLVVDFAERGDEQDHADWLDARFVE